MTIPTKLLALLRDPIGLEPLELDDTALVNRARQRRYPIVDCIPVLLDEADLGPQNLKIRKMYKWMARGFDAFDRLANLITRHALAKARRMMASRLALQPGNQCLYTSMGTGLDVPFLAEQISLNEIDLVGLDLSMEMLRKCQPKLRPYEAHSLLVQANAERLPFADRSFDVVWHVGGINLFDRPAMAVQEMVRVARPGALIMVVDETKDVIKRQYQRNPLTRAYCEDASTDFHPRNWVPAEVASSTYEEILKGRIYLLSFRAPPR
ncbi:MAG TPA: methyltransferase domain-containing protein [Verrucomicrobiae bacterium]|nr:methyltransferase domain-containing protein [Verrucomicrobiae bacterium]